MLKIALSCSSIAAAMLLPTMSHAQTRDIGVHGEMLDRIAAIVNDGLVLKSELDAQMDAVTKRLQEQKVELPSQSVLKQQVLDRLIVQEIEAQHAKRVGLTVSDEQLNSALQEIASRNKIPFDQLPTALAAQGEDFGQLAIANSNSQTALDGGQLGWRKGTQLPQFILDLVTQMKPGAVSAPVRTPSGFHIVKLNERRSGEAQVIINQIHARHILMKTNELDDDETVRQKLSKLRDRILKGENFAGLASTNSADPGSAPDGGDLGWSGPGTFVPEFDKAIADLKTNEISEPFKSRYGWHIVQMLGTRTYDSTDDMRRQRAFAAIRESKADEETELWLRRLRDEAFVEVKM